MNGPGGMPTLDVLESVEESLTRCKEATISGALGLLEVVATLHSRLTVLKDMDRDRDDDEFRSRRTRVLTKTAETIFSFYGFVAGYGDQLSITDRELEKQLDLCLGLCGLRITFLETLNCLKEVASMDKSPEKLSSKNIVPLQCLFASLRIIRQILSLSPLNDQQGNLTKDAHSIHQFSLQQLIQEYAYDMVNHGKPDDEESMLVTGNGVHAVDDLVKGLVLLPVKIAAACHAAKLHLPSWASRDRYAPVLVEVAAHVASNEGLENASARKYFFFSLARIMVRHGGVQVLATGLYQFWSTCSFPTIDKSFIFRDMMKSILVASDCVHLMQAIFRLSINQAELLPTGQYTKSNQLDMVMRQCLSFMRDTCLGILQESDIIRDEFVRVMILSPSPSFDTSEQKITIRCICNLLLSCAYSFRDTALSAENTDNNGGCNKMFLEYIEKVTFVWCAPRFLSGISERQQWFVTEFILLALDHVDQKSLYEVSPLIEMLTSGVSIRLASSSSSVRKDGMRVGEKMAKILDQELKFDELNDERESNEMSVETSRSTEVGSRKQVVPEKKSFNRSKTGTRHRPVDPDEELFSDSDECAESSVHNDVDNFYLDDDSDWGEDDLIPYDLDDDEQDLHEVKKPKYVRECLDMLRYSGDDFVALRSIQTALEQLPLLVQDNPSDLKLFIEPLTMELLRIQNRFDLETFGELRFDGLCSLTLKEPVTVGGFLCAEVFQDDVIMDVRLDILHVLRYSASALSGTFQLQSRQNMGPVNDKVFGKRKLVPFSTCDSPKSKMDGSDIVSLTLEKITRRWGKGRNDFKTQTVVNVFGSIAPYFFYPLLYGFMSSRKRENVWKGHNGTFLLSQVLSTLSTFLLKATNPNAIIMASDLFELAWSLRDAEDSAVRKSILLSMVASCHYFGQEKLISILRDRQLLRSYLARARIEDVDDDCRRLSSALSDIFATYSIE